MITGKSTESKIEKPGLERLNARKISESHPGSGLCVDGDKFFICPTTTPLWYTQVYSQLEPEDQLLYNQLHGLMAIELTQWFESVFLGALDNVRHEIGKCDGSDELVGAVESFASEEREHIRHWTCLHSRSLQAIKLPVGSRVLQQNRLVENLLAMVAKQAKRLPAMFCIMLALEEHGLEVSKRTIHQTDFDIDALHVRAHRDHLRDEAKHVRWDCLLIDRYFRRMSSAGRAINASVFHHLLLGFMHAPKRGAMNVLRRLLLQRPHLRTLWGRMKREMSLVGQNVEYRRMMYSHDSTPVLFSRLGMFPVFSRTLVALVNHAEPDSECCVL